MNQQNKTERWEVELEDLFSTESTEDGGNYLIASVKEVKSLFHQAILSAEERAVKGFAKYADTPDGWAEKYLSSLPDQEELTSKGKK